MKYPKIKSVVPENNHILIIKFDNNQTKKYDVTPLLKKEMFTPLNNPGIFNSVHVEQAGYAVVWNNDIDISEYELWNHGQAI